MRKALLILLALALVTAVFVSCSNDPKTVTVTFDPGDAWGEPYTQAVVSGVRTKLVANKFTYDSYGFAGWSMSPTGGHDYDDEDTVTLTSDLTLYATWSELYSIKATATDHGTITPVVDSYIVRGTSQIINLDITLDEGYYLAGVDLTGSDNIEAFYLFHTVFIPMDSTGDIVVTPEFSAKQAEVGYVDAEWNDSAVVLTNKVIENYGYSLVTKDLTSWANGNWYVVAGDVIIKDRITVTGDVSLILANHATLKAEKGITVAEGATLTIYETPLNPGKLLIDSVESGNAGIGGTANDACGTVTIKGGVIQVTGGENSAGIGGGDNHAAGTINVLHGSVVAEGGRKGSGIGGGNNGNGGTVNLYGGKIKATGFKTNGVGGAGIGGGYRGDGGTVNIFTATVEAYGGDYAAGIGGGHYNSGGTVTISGGNVKAEGNRGAAGIGGGMDGNGADVTITGGIINIKGGEGDIDMDTPWYNIAIGSGSNYNSYGELDNKSLTVQNVTLEVMNHNDQNWYDWDRENRYFMMRTKQTT